MTRRAWVFKAKGEPEDEYEAQFREHGYSPEFIPVLDHHCASLPELRLILESGPSGQGITGVIVTSQRAVETLAKASERVNKGLWHTVSAYVVGPTTAECLRQLDLFGDYVVADKATALCNQMERIQFDGQLLFLAGDKRREVIPNWLAGAKIPFKEIRTYATCAHPRLSDRLTEAAPNVQKSDWTVYFSPSGINYIQQANPVLADQFFNTKVAAIGPTTADHLVSLGIKVDVIASRPDGYHLVAAMAEYDQKINEISR
ncbi:hypothetical protein DFQ28_004746 [Apophysomyces sp. BC1034]|nr:hypothetical protein DFQ30_010603 [Apophysomyces sp. BC1015]KAG0180940.1 hypothetical protein DFQ29_009761 [Apophysomyces sp. BC1021]KAG0188511.1 hypothetical protein DFQ28_004746 [Apophysomyces sp. BC1034]